MGWSFKKHDIGYISNLNLMLGIHFYENKYVDLILFWHLKLLHLENDRVAKLSFSFTNSNGMALIYEYYEYYEYYDTLLITQPQSWADCRGWEERRIIYSTVYAVTVDRGKRLQVIKYGKLPFWVSQDRIMMWLNKNQQICSSRQRR